MPRTHPLARLLGESPDFARKDALADALLNPQDRAYTVQQLFAFIAICGLTCVRWVRQAPDLAKCGALAQTPLAIAAIIAQAAGRAAPISRLHKQVRHLFERLWQWDQVIFATVE